MNMILNVIMAYVTINVIGSIYYIIKNRKEDYESVSKRTYDRLDNKGLNKKDVSIGIAIGWIIGTIVVIIIDIVMWAPLTLFNSIEKSEG